MIEERQLLLNRKILHTDFNNNRIFPAHSSDYFPCRLRHLVSCPIVYRYHVSTPLIHPSRNHICDKHASSADEDHLHQTRNRPGLKYQALKDYWALNSSWRPSGAEFQKNGLPCGRVAVSFCTLCRTIPIPLCWSLQQAVRSNASVTRSYHWAPRRWDAQWERLA